MNISEAGPLLIVKPNQELVVITFSKKRTNTQSKNI
jgi:hypothetical protein